MKFTIDRKTWLRGKRDSSLLTEEGTMCCMGQVCSQLGLAQSEMLRVPYLRNAIGWKGVIAERLKPFVDEKGVEPKWIMDCYAVNDDTKINDVQREASLSEAFAAHGHELVFIN